MERTLHALNNLERTHSRTGRMSDSVSAISPTYGDDGTAAKRMGYRTHGRELVEICAKVGGHGQRKLGPNRQTDRQPALLQAFQPSDQRPVVVYAPPDIRELVNMECGSQSNYFNWTLLHCAIFTGNEKMVKCLLKWGADATSKLVSVDLKVGERWFSDHGDPLKHTPIGLAAVLKLAGIVTCLLANSASPYDGGSWGSLTIPTYSLCRHDDATCEALCRDPRYPPSVNMIMPAR